MTQENPKLDAQTQEKIEAHFEICKFNGDATTEAGRRKIRVQMASYLRALCDFDIIAPDVCGDVLFSGLAWVKNPKKPFLGKYARIELDSELDGEA